MEFQDLRTKFAPFEQHLRNVQDLIEDGEDPLCIPGHLTTTIPDEAITEYFVIPSEDTGQQYVGQLFRPDPELRGDFTPLPQQIEAKARLMATALGHTGLEQIVAYANTDVLAIVTEHAKGRPLYSVRGDALEYLPLATYFQLFEVFKTMEDLELVVETDYYTSIICPEIDPDNPHLVPGLIVTQYRDGSKTQSEHAIALGAEMAIMESPGMPVPLEAVRYYIAVDKYLGKAAGLEIINTWLHSGYAIPFINYDVVD